MIRRTPLWWRFAFLFLGILILFWLPIEDRSTISVLIFSAMICTLAALASRSFIPGFKEQPDEHSSAPRPRNTLYIVVPAWLIAGLGVTVVALLLMAIKTGLHGHGTPDYTPEQMVRVLSLTPLWVIVGLMIGLVALFWKK